MQVRWRGDAGSNNGSLTGAVPQLSYASFRLRATVTRQALAV